MDNNTEIPGSFRLLCYSDHRAATSELSKYFRQTNETVQYKDRYVASFQSTHEKDQEPHNRVKVISLVLLGRL